jgi:hypothetical protein
MGSCNFSNGSTFYKHYSIGHANVARQRRYVVGVARRNDKRNNQVTIITPVKRDLDYHGKKAYSFGVTRYNNARQRGLKFHY